MKIGHRTAFVVWTVVVIFGAGLLYNGAVYPRLVNERRWVEAERYISFRGPTPVKIGGCKPFRLQSLSDLAVVLTPKIETPSPDSRCTIAAYHLETQLTGKWQVQSYGATLVITPQGARSAVTVEPGETEKILTLVITIIDAVFLWAVMWAVIILFVGSVGRRSPSSLAEETK